MNQAGRPPISGEHKDIIFRKLEPYVKAGLSLHKACLQAQIPKSTVYDIAKEDKEFAEKLLATANYHAVLTTSIITNELERIKTKQKKQALSKDDLRFVQWVAINSNSTKEEYGRKEDIANKEEESREEKMARQVQNDPRLRQTLVDTVEAVRNKMIREGNYNPTKSITK